MHSLNAEKPTAKAKNSFKKHIFALLLNGIFGRFKIIYKIQLIHNRFKIKELFKIKQKCRKFFINVIEYFMTAKSFNFPRKNFVNVILYCLFVLKSQYTHEN